jgi:hypothetical protein
VRAVWPGGFVEAANLSEEDDNISAENWATGFRRASDSISSGCEHARRGAQGQTGPQKALLGLLSQGHSLACCAVTVAEVYSGSRAREAVATEELVSELMWSKSRSRL